MMSISPTHQSSMKVEAANKLFIYDFFFSLAHMLYMYECPIQESPNGRPQCLLLIIKVMKDNEKYA
jgi:hypothetical protein